jgi:hypothetical protein
MKNQRVSAIQETARADLRTNLATAALKRDRNICSQFLKTPHAKNKKPN